MPPIGDGLRPTVLWNWRVKPPQRRRRRLGIDQNIDAVPAGVRRVSIGAQRRKGVQRAIVCSRKGDLEHIADVWRLSDSVHRTLGPTRRTSNCRRFRLRSHQDLQLPPHRPRRTYSGMSSRPGRPTQRGQGKIPVDEEIAARVGHIPDGYVGNEKNAGSSRKASEMDVSARAAVKSTV